jgi:hypothetical protein
MHRGAHCRVAERVFGDAVRPLDPAPQRGELRRIRLRKADARRFQRGLGRGDGLDEFLLQKRHVVRVRVRAEAAHRRRRRMRMRGGNQHAVRWNARLRLRHLLGVIQHVTAHHATVRHHEGDLRFPVRGHDGPCVHPRVDLVHVAAQHPAIHQHRQLRRRDVDDRGTGLEFGMNGGREEENSEGKESANHGPKHTALNAPSSRSRNDQCVFVSFRYSSSQNTFRFTGCLWQESHGLRRRLAGDSQPCPRWAGAYPARGREACPQASAECRHACFSEISF